MTANPIALAHPCVCVRIYHYWCHAVIDRRDRIMAKGLRYDGAVTWSKGYCHRYHWLIAGLFAGNQGVRCA